jgi:glycosyltransferase involved in cell wall biosynthesis
VLVPPRHAAALADGILALLRGPRDRAAMGTAGPAVVREYDLARALDGFIRLYDTLAADSVGAPPPSPAAPARVRAPTQEHAHG